MGRRWVIATGIAACALMAAPVAQAQGLEPDGWILFEHFGQKPDGSSPEFDFNQRWIWMARPDGSELHELAPGTPIHGKSSPDVSADGTRVAFASWSPLSRLWDVGLDGSEPRLLSTDCSGREGDCWEWDPAWSPDGTHIAFVRQDWDGAAASNMIGIREVATGESRYLDATTTDAADGWIAQPTWSPDGTQIAYHRATDWRPHPGWNDYPESTRIWIIGADGTGLHELATPATSDAADPDWSPDGSRIVYADAGFRETEGVGDLGPLYIHTIRPDGTDDRRLTLGGAPTWLPEGDRIMFWGDRTWSLIDADGANEHQIDPAHLAWFADGLGYGYYGTWVPPQD